MRRKAKASVRACSRITGRLLLRACEDLGAGWVSMSIAKATLISKRVYKRMLLKVCRLKVFSSVNLASYDTRQGKTTDGERASGSTIARREGCTRPFARRASFLGGCSRTYVGSVERAERNVSIDNIEQFACALGNGYQRFAEARLIVRPFGLWP